MQKLLVVGLGNPGPQYSFNRHNIGFMVLDSLAKMFNLNFTLHKNLKSYIALHSRVILCKPMTFMNTSGEAVQSVKNYYKTDEIFVIHDDLEVVFGKLKFKKGGGNAGHNGLKSIDSYCGQDYLRARCGIGRPKNGEDVASYVLSDFTESPKDLIAHCARAIDFFITHQDFQQMQNFFTKQVL